MTVDEIFAKLAQRMIGGMMYHDQMADYYNFLGMCGYKRCHEYHFLKESIGYRKLCRYYMEHYNKFMPELPVSDPKAIPQTWKQYKRQDVDMATKKAAIRDGMDSWVRWESDTKALYESSCKDLFDIGETSAATFVESFAEGAAHELKTAERDFLNKKSADFDMPLIMSEQKMIHDKCKRKMKRIL